MNKPATVEKTTVVEKGLGALSSPDIPSPYLTFGGVRRWAYNIAMTQGTTTPCIIPAPAATSTLVKASVTVQVASSTAQTITIAKNAGNLNASTTLIAAATLAGNGQGTLVASSTPTGALLDGTNTFAPSANLVVTMTGGQGTSNPVGRCIGVFEETNNTPN